MPVSAKKRRNGDKSDPKNSPPEKSDPDFSKLFLAFLKAGLSV